jgi:hypothetical protein
MKTGHLFLTFPDQGRIDVAEIGHFLFLVRGAYAAALSFARSEEGDFELIDFEKLEERLRRKLGRLDVTGIDGLFSKDLREDSPVAERIGRESPLLIVMEGALVALGLAVILSGGKIKFDVKVAKLEVELPPIGEGIKKLREALSRAPKAQLGYGIKSKCVTLTAIEYTELMKFNPRTKTRGGFQRLLIGMQYRVNQVTHELPLSDHEMDLILRHGRHPEKGGWQKSIRTIFGRHFEFPGKCQTQG